MVRRDDLKFLFEVSTRAMLPVRKAQNPNLKIDIAKEFKAYVKKIIPEKIQINGKNVGRLPVDRTSEEIYVGDIQILPEWQKQRIGSAIFSDLIKHFKKF